MSPGLPKLVRAAGGVVWKRSDHGPIEVLLVHRPAYDDWTFPKGKVIAEETDEDAALREVAEETGLRCRLGAELATSDYTDAGGRPKRVRYWAMNAVEGAFAPNHEVDATRWVTVAEAGRLLTYGRDQDVLKSLAAGQG